MCRTAPLSKLHSLRIHSPKHIRLPPFCLSISSNQILNRLLSWLLRMMDFTIRPATLEDCKDISRMILELAAYQKMSDQIKITQRDLEQDGFSKNPFFHGIIAEVPEHLKSKDGHTKIGYSLYFYTYGSFKGRTVYMEDLYMMPEFRGKGIGKALMAKVAQLGLAAGCTQLNFTVLDWNKSSLDFYLKQGCWDVTSDLGYHCMRCEGDALQHLAQGDL